MKLLRRPASGFVLLPVILTLALLALVTALLLETGGTGGSVAAGQQQSDALAYAAEAGFNHGRALLEQNGCLNVSTVADIELGDYTYSAIMPGTGAAVPPATYKLTAVADAWLNQDSGNTNYGTDQVLKNLDDDEDRRTIMRFDLSGVPANLAVASATLRIYVKKANNNPVLIHRVTEVWNESTVTWNNTAGDYNEDLEHATFVPGAVGPLSVDLTPLVRQWVAGKISNNGVMFISANDEEESEYHSREDSTLYRPRLDIVSRPNAFYDLSATGRDAAGTERNISRTIEGPADSALFLDYFDVGYAGNDGTRNFTGNWQEFGESNGSGSGAVRVAAYGDCAYSNCLKIDASLLGSAGAWRELGLGGADSAVLSLHTKPRGGNYSLEVSGNGGASWQTLQTYSGSNNDQQRDSFDISAYAGPNTRVRIRSTALAILGGDLYVDDFEIDATCGP